MIVFSLLLADVYAQQSIEAVDIIPLATDEILHLDNTDGRTELWTLALDVDGIEVPLDVLADELTDVGGPDLWSEAVDVSRDAASGLPTGKRQHKPINVTAVTCVTVWGVTVCVSQ